MDKIEELEKNIHLKIKDMMLDIYRTKDTDKDAGNFSDGKIEGLEDALHKILTEIERVKEMPKKDVEK